MGGARTPRPHDTLLGTQISPPCHEVVIDHNTVSESSNRVTFAGKKLKNETG
jgi:hypothetical protein